VRGRAFPGGFSAAALFSDAGRLDSLVEKSTALTYFVLLKLRQ
jgi:hypothetical protein